ncbi:MAG TPA: DUF72 domain-containing protein [Candidatus Krumholzibacteria bacterium]
MSIPLENRVHIGPAGWDYPDWDGIFYPARRPRGFDALAYVASYFTLVEINSTFYRVPAPHVVRRWAERVADRPQFTFTLKAHQSLTHHGFAGTPAELDPLRRAIDPLADTARLGAVLLQFPWSFRFDDESRAHLDARVRELSPYPLAVEVRHGSWASEEAARYLSSLGVSVCGIDQPVIGESLPPYVYRAGSAGAYFRFHGRNYRNWFAEDAGRDARYDYLYSPGELSPWAGVIREAAKSSAVHVVLNNHFRGQAPANAFEMAFALFGRKPDAPVTLRRAIPQIAECTVARAAPGGEPTLFDV